MKMENVIEGLEQKEKDIIAAGKRVAESNKNLYLFDTFCIAQLNRCVNLLDGFCQLARSDNFIAAFPLVRMHLDTLQRLYGIQLIEGNVDDITGEILNGKAINKFKIKSSARTDRLTDAFLCEKLSLLPGFDWVKDVYKVGNDFVHLPFTS
jgi:hypothetical protein